MRPLVVALVTVLGCGSLVVLAVPATDAVEPPAISLSVTGEGVETYPSFDPAITRYAATTSSETDGAVTVTVTGGDPAAAVRVNGRPAPDGSRELTGLAEGDEISVLVTDGTGTTAYSVIYLPPGFPGLVTDTSLPTDEAAPGVVLLTLDMFAGTQQTFETAVDGNGVPVYVHEVPSALDLKPALGGHYSVSRHTTSPGGTGYDIVELDAAFTEIARRHTAAPVVDTDSHDSVLMPDGSIYFLSYEPNADTGKTDTIVQQVSAAGEVLFTWSSAAYVGDSVVPGTNPDYAHSNSIQVLPDGDLLVSFRHFNSAFKIARTSHDGHAPGDVIWKLGGRDSTFTFEDENGDPIGGPCLQHTVYEIGNGHILTFDNGSWGFESRCTDPANPTGPTIARMQTRIAEWSLDEGDDVATLAWVYEPANHYALFAGSAQRLDNDNTLIGWASETKAIASEVDPAGEVVWALRDPATDRRPDIDGVQRYFTYRAFKAEVPDAQRPAVSIVEPAAGAAYLQGALVTPAADCTDRGGATLQTCSIPALDTSTPGEHAYTVTATDGAGNTGTATRRYTVLGPGRPDIAARATGTSYVGANRYDWAGKHRVVVRLPRAGSARISKVRITNSGDQPARFTLERTPNSRRFRASLAATGGVRRSPVLAPGTSWVVIVEVTRTRAARPGDQRDFRFRVRSTTQASLRDAVVIRARALR